MHRVAGQFPTMMPMSPSIAPLFTSRYPEAAIIFDNLHSLHDVVSDILANPSVPRSEKRKVILTAAAAYRDNHTSVTSVADWHAMSAEMGLQNMGGPAPIRGVKLKPDSAGTHKH
jgi:hypothetical protein